MTVAKHERPHPKSSRITIITNNPVGGHFCEDTHGSGEHGHAMLDMLDNVLICAFGFVPYLVPGT